MSAQPAERLGADEPFEVIHLGGEAAAIVPVAELRRLRAVERRGAAAAGEGADVEAPRAGHRAGGAGGVVGGVGRGQAEALEEAEIEATLAAHRAWVADGRPGAVSHEEAMKERLGGGQ